MSQKRPMRRFCGWRFLGQPSYTPRHPNSRQIAERRGFDIALDARHLTRQMDTRTPLQLKMFVEL